PYVANYVVRGGTPAAAPMESRTQPYHPASPGVGHTPATPGVGGSGGSGGNNRIAATPSVAGTGGNNGGGSNGNTRIAAGPKPSELGINTGVPAPPSSGGIAKAHAFATPATAQQVGGSPPASVKPRPRDTVAGR